MRQVILTPAEEGGYYATVPSLPGCISQDDTWEETIENIQEAIKFYLEVLIEDGQPVPDDNLNRVLVVVEAA